MATRSGARGWSVRGRILVSILLVAALGLGLAGFVTFLVQRDRTLTEIEDRLATSVEAARQTLDGTTGEPPPSTTRDALRTLIARFVPAHDASSLGIVDGAAAFVPSITIDHELQLVPGFVDRVVAETVDGGVHIGTLETGGDTLRYIAAPLSVAGDPQHGIYVVALNVNEELNELYNSFTTYALVAAAALLAVGLVGWFVAGRLLRPIRQLSSAASRITASDRSERIPITGNDDVSALTRTVNDMLDRLDAALTSQRQLLDDVRHELKTPITIVRGHLELLDPSAPADVTATRDLAIDELDRMAGLVDDIESFAETSAAPPARVPTQLADLTATVFAKARILPDHEWQLEESATVTTLLDPSRITQAWLQLAENAAKYAPEGSAIRLGSSAGTGTVKLWVADAGPGIPVEAHVRIFERFGRIDGGRGIRGSGLGLPIVRAIARAHGGDVRLESVDGGSRFTIELPLRGAP
jgi:signal transduction histidine kinase